MRVLFTGSVCALMLATAGAVKAQEATTENAAATNAGEATADGAVSEDGQGVVGEIAQGVAEIADGVRDVADGDRASHDSSANQDQGSQAHQSVDGQSDRNARWRFVRHHGEWWYYTPDQQWLFHRGGQWHTFDANAPQQQAMHGGQRRQSFEGGVDAAGYAADSNVQGATEYAYGAQPGYQSYSPTHSSRSAYSGRRYSYSGDASSSAEVSRIPSGSRTESRYGASTGFSPMAPRMINNNPRPATWGRVR